MIFYPSIGRSTKVPLFLKYASIRWRRRGHFDPSIITCKGVSINFGKSQNFCKQHHLLWPFFAITQHGPNSQNIYTWRCKNVKTHPSVDFTNFFLLKDVSPIFRVGRTNIAGKVQITYMKGISCQRSFSVLFLSSLVVCVWHILHSYYWTQYGNHRL